MPSYRYSHATTAWLRRHMMSYDQHGKHSTWEFGKQSVMQGVAMLPPAKLTMGLPFYSRDVRTGEWDTYEVSTDAASRKASAHPPLPTHVRAHSSHRTYFSFLTCFSCCVYVYVQNLVNKILLLLVLCTLPLVDKPCTAKPLHFAPSFLLPPPCTAM